MSNIKFLSLVVPTYKQERTIEGDIRNLQAALAPLPFSHEIIVVVDGMLDKTYAKVRKLRSKNVRIYKYRENQGKGFAVRYGMLKAKGDIVGFIDSGMDIDPNGISMLMSHMIWYNADVIVGSKLHPVSQVYYPLWRKILSRGYRVLTRLMFGFAVRDTQVGIKLFKKHVVKDVLPRLLVKKYAFDIEMLAVSYDRGYKRIFEAPVKIDFKDSATISVNNLGKVIFSMLWDTFAVFYRLRILRYYDNPNRIPHKEKIANSVKASMNRRKSYSVKKASA